mgnify:CR=1 FL=1
MTSSQRFIDYSSHFNTTGFKAAFSLKQDSEINEKDRIFLATTLHLDSAKLVIPKQTHSNHVKFCKKGGLPKDTDGLVSEKESCVLSIQVADCMPIYFVHKKDSVFGLVHVGWRGLVSGIINQCSKLLVEQKYNLAHFQILIGPSIQSCCFEVSEDVIDQFDPKFYEEKGSGKYRVHLQKLAMTHCLESGFIENEITVLSDCTFCEQEKYHSYRRNGKKSGKNDRTFRNEIVLFET